MQNDDVDLTKHRLPLFLTKNEMEADAIFVPFLFFGCAETADILVVGFVNLGRYR